MTWSARLALPSFLISIFWYPLGELRRASQRRSIQRRAANLNYTGSLPIRENLANERNGGFRPRLQI